MSVSYDFVRAVLVLRMNGEYDPADIRIALGNALRERQAPDVVGVLFDVSNSTAITRRTPVEMRNLAAVLAHNSTEFGGRLALVAASEHAHAMMRLGCADVQAAGVPARCFWNPEDALAWLEDRA